LYALRVESRDLMLRQVFAVAGNARRGTEALFVVLAGEGLKGLGQASFPPYMLPTRAENQAQLLDWASKGPRDLEEWEACLDQPERIPATCLPALAALDMAWHNAIAQRTGQALWQVLGVPNPEAVRSCHTVGIGNAASTRAAVEAGRHAPWIKLKLDADLERTRAVIALLTRLTDQPIAVDFNQAFVRREQAIRAIECLPGKQFFLVEQPLTVQADEDNLWLRARTSLAIYGDESIQSEQDLQQKAELFSGVNVKLMKCGGLRPAIRLHDLARSRGLGTLIGCMAESVVATTAAAQIAALFDYADLDGHVLISNDWS